MIADVDFVSTWRVIHCGYNKTWETPRETIRCQVQPKDFMVMTTRQIFEGLYKSGCIIFGIRRELNPYTAWKNGFAHLCKWANMYQIWYLLEGKHGEDRIYLRTWANMVFTTFASDLLSCLLHLCSLVNLSKSIFSSSVTLCYRAGLMINSS